MTITETDIAGVYIVEPDIFEDSRGFFMESWSERAFEELGLFYRFVQDGHSFSASEGTLRGIHFQKGEQAQAKLVRCIRGAVLDVAVDLRPNSPTYRAWFSLELSEKNRKQLLISRGLGHGFVTLTPQTELLYKADNFYAPEAESGVRWNDPELAVNWGVERPKLSPKDQMLPWLRDAETGF